MQTGHTPQPEAGRHVLCVAHMKLNVGCLSSRRSLLLTAERVTGRFSGISLVLFQTSVLTQPLCFMQFLSPPPLCVCVGPRVLCRVGTHSTAELHPQPPVPLKKQPASGFPTPVPNRCHLLGTHSSESRVCVYWCHLSTPHMVPSVPQRCERAISDSRKPQPFKFKWVPNLANTFPLSLEGGK